MPRPRTGTKPKHGIAKHAVRSKTSIVIPDREIATLPYSSSMPSNQNLIRSNIRSAALASRATEGPTFWLLSTEVTTGPNHKRLNSGATAEKTSVPVTSEATERRIYAPATAERLEETSSIPVTCIQLSSPTHKTITPQAETMPYVIENPREDGQPKDNEGSVPDNRYNHRNGELEAGEIQVLRSSLTRLRRPLNRFQTGELETKPKKKVRLEIVFVFSSF